MNQRRVVGILQELATVNEHAAALQRELADAMAEEPKKRPRAKRLAEPSAQPSEESIKTMRRTLRQQGVRA